MSAGRRARAGLELRHMPPESSLIFSGCRTSRAVSSPAISQTMAEPLRPHQVERRVLDAGAHDAQRLARHARQPEQRADLDMVGLDRIAGFSPSLAVPWITMCWCRCPRYWRRSAQECARSCTMRLGGGVPTDTCVPLAATAATHRVLSSRYRGLVGKTFGAMQLLCSSEHELSWK